MYFSFSLFMLPILPFYGIHDLNLISIFAILGLVFILTLIGQGYVIYTADKLPISLVTSVELIEPVIVTLLAILIFNQIPNLQKIIGGSITLISIYFILENENF
ncbi:EamA family transporter [Saccharolobus islandicus]